MNGKLARLRPVPSHARRMLDLSGGDDAVETGPGRGKCERCRDNTEKSADDVSLERNAEDRRRDIDKPERKRGNEAQEQEVAQRLLLEALAQLGKPGGGALAERLADGRARDQDQERGADGG